jgi:5-methylcytosine-specific restriction endonuclease McrA
VCREAERQNKAGYRNRHRAKARAAQRDYDRRTRDQVAARKAANRLANPDKFRKRSAEYAKANPDVVHLNKLRRRAREVGSDNRKITANDWRRLCDHYRHRCAYCGEQRPLTRDHVIPLSRGGRNAIGNLVPACGACNYSKRDKFVVEWRQLIRRRAAQT